MFSVWRVLVDRVFTPKNGPVPERRVNGYDRTTKKGKVVTPLASPHSRPAAVACIFLSHVQVKERFGRIPAWKIKNTQRLGEN